jgi:hypothetical protein
LLIFFIFLTWLIAFDYATTTQLWPSGQRTQILAMHSLSLLFLTGDACFALRDIYRYS